MEDRGAEYGQKLQDCIAYFKQRKVYEKLFAMFRDKYRSLGRFGGTVQLKGLDQEERRQLGGFLQKNYGGKDTVSVSASAMEKALEGSRFSGLKWEMVLEEYFQEEMVGRKEQRQQEESRKERFFSGIIAAASGNPGALWLREVLRTKGEGYRLLTEHYRRQPGRLEETLSLLLGAVPRLPFFSGEGQAVPYELTAVFAAKTTGDPHFLDAGTLGEQLLCAFLREQIPGSGGWTEFRAEEKAELFWKAGLLRDELSNNILVYGLEGVGRDGKPHLGLEGFLRQREPLQLTLMTMRKLERVFPQGEQKVYIVENPAVFTKLILAWPEAAVLCGNGQIRLAVLVLLDLFPKEVHFLYGGDYDPEGLQIAQKLKERYGERLQLWKYRREFYEKYRSDVEVSEKSLKQLDHIYLEELQGIKEEMLLYRKAAYQEAMIEEYLCGA